MSDVNPNMLELAKKLVPSIEEGMPEDIAQAFAEGKIKTIFRTTENAGLSTAAKLGKSSFGGRVDPGSTYFLHENGGIARFGRHGAGWGDDRSVKGSHLDSKKSSFLDEAIFTNGDNKYQNSTLNRGMVDSGISSGEAYATPKIGHSLVEFDSDFSRVHTGHPVSDIYHSSGSVEYLPEIGGSFKAGSTINPVNTDINSIDIVSEKGSTIPRLKSGSSPEEVFQAESQARANAMLDSDYAAHQKANKLKSLAENPDDLYAKYLDHVGRIKSEGGILSPDSISLRRWFPRCLHK
jgi:hypothetical protein